LEGYEERLRDQKLSQAFLGKLILSAWVEDVPSVHELIGEHDPVPNFENAEEFKEYMKRQREKEENPED
jgi:hypothetical protein